MLCLNCQHPNPNTAKFCSECGARLTEGTAAPVTTTALRDVTGPVLSGLFHGAVIIGNVTYTSAQADDTPALLGHYLDWLIGVCAPLKLKAINQSAVTSDKQPLGLASVYVDLNLDFSLPAKLTLAQYLTQKESDVLKSHPEAMRDPEKTRQATALEALAQHPRLVLLGAPGSGKSTLSLYLALSLAQAALGDSKALARLGQTWRFGALLPVRVELRKFAASLPNTLKQATAKHLWDFVFDEITNDGLPPHTGAIVQETAQKTGALFLLDGLDEAGDETRRARVLEAVTAFTAPASAGAHSRFLLTARPYAWEAPEKQTGLTLADRSAVYRLADFDKTQIETFIQRWYEAVSALGWMNASEAREKTAALQSAVQRADLTPLAHNPLLLTLMATLHSNRTRLPEDRADLYNEVVELLLQRWNESSGADRGLLDALDIPTLKLANLREVIELLAFEAHSAHVGKEGMADKERPADVSEAELLAAFAPLLNNDLNKARQVVDYIEKRAGLLLGQGTRGRVRQFTFPHRTFQEYLAACHLAARTDFCPKAAELAYADPTHWREVLRLAARRASSGWGVLAADNLVHGQNIQDWQAENPVTERDWQVAVLAGEQLLEIGLAMLDSDAGYRAKRKRVAGWLAALAQTGALPVPDRARAGMVLAQLGDPRPGVGLVSADRRGLTNNEVRLWGDKPEHIGLPDMVWLKVAGAHQYHLQTDEGEKGVYDIAPFYIAKYPVTYTQFQAFVEASDGFRNSRWWDGLAADEEHKLASGDQAFKFGNHPRERVSWYDALAFCRWLNARLGWPDIPAKLTTKTLDTYTGLRLLTEWEWQWAASPQGKQYPWGDEWDSAQANTNESGLARTTAVGIYPTGAAPCGALDMSGNVWEWCLNESEKPTNIGLSGSHDRVVRGGSWSDSQQGARAALRLDDHPGYRNNLYGFRVCVRPPDLTGGRV